MGRPSMTVIRVSQQELERLRVLVELGDGRLGIDAAATLLGVGRRQLFRLRTAFQDQGAEGLVSRKRGRPSNRAHGTALRATAIGLVRERYADFGPTLAAEKLLELHGLPLGVEKLRQWMIADGLWMRCKDRRPRVFQPRPRRDCLGELVQIDGSEHWWFEDRGPQCTLLVFIDDATSRLMELRLVETEAAFGYFQSTRAYLAAHGKPVTFYSDKHSIFRISKADAVQGRGMTQFGRALHDLNIDILCANTPQAKGRVERANKTLQDRLVKEFRLQGISSIEAGNAALPAFMAAYNARFAKVAGDARDMHRPVTGTDDLDTAFSWQEERTVSGSLTLQYEKVLFLLRPSELTRSLARKRVVVHDFPDGRFEIRHQGLALPYLVFDKGRQVQQGSVVANKNLGAAMTVIKAKQARRGNMIAGSLAALAPAVGAPPDRLGPVLAYVQTLQGQSGKKPSIATGRPSAARASGDISVGEKL